MKATVTCCTLSRVLQLNKEGWGFRYVFHCFRLCVHNALPSLCDCGGGTDCSIWVHCDRTAKTSSHVVQKRDFREDQVIILPTISTFIKSFIHHSFIHLCIYSFNLLFVPTNNNLPLNYRLHYDINLLDKIEFAVMIPIIVDAILWRKHHPVHCYLWRMWEEKTIKIVTSVRQSMKMAE